MQEQKESMETKGSFNRRQFLKPEALAGAGLVLSGKLYGRKAGAQEPQSCPEIPVTLNLTPFVDGLPIAPTFSPTKWQYGNDSCPRFAKGSVLLLKKSKCPLIG